MSADVKTDPYTELRKAIEAGGDAAFELACTPDVVAALLEERDRVERNRDMWHEQCTQQAERIMALRHERDRFASDAARWQFARKHWGYITESYENEGPKVASVQLYEPGGWDVDPDSLDAAIDAAMLTQPPSLGGAND